MSSPYCAGNWKMNMNPQEAVQHVQALLVQTEKLDQSCFLLFPPALVAADVATQLRGTSMRWGGQNCYHELKGAFTGENSPQTLKDMGASFCLVGHSERRQIFGETDDLCSKKIQILQSVGLTPLLCVGETLAERQSGQTGDVVLRQLRTGLQGATSTVWIAYEPVWAIGTGLVASSEQVAEVHSLIFKFLHEWSPQSASTTPILYGGSVKPNNAGPLASLAHVDGFLVGGASLVANDFVQIQQAARV